MGNNAAYSSFQRTVIALADAGALDLATLDTLAEEWRGTDIDSGGDLGITTKDGRSLEEVCIALVDPAWNTQEAAPEDDSDEPVWEKFHDITYNRWGWR